MSLETIRTSERKFQEHENPQKENDLKETNSTVTTTLKVTQMDSLTPEEIDFENQSVEKTVVVDPDNKWLTCLLM